MSILLIGLNHKSAPIEVREKLSISYAQLALKKLEIKELSANLGCAILSTCNRTEMYMHTDDVELAHDQIIALYEDVSELSKDELIHHLYKKIDREAAKHLLSVAAGLDSMVLGESQIQGQVQDSYQQALNLNISDSVINTLFMTALTAGKRVRTETQIDRQAVNISSAAVEMAEHFFGSLEDKTVLVLGAGETSELTSRHLVAHGISSIMVANRTFERANWLAQEIGGTAICFDQLNDYFSKADIIISSTASPHYVLHYDDFQSILDKRDKPLLMIDIAVPRDIDPRFREDSHVRLFDLDDLQSQVALNKAYREKEAVLAREIVDEELENYKFWLDTLWVIPTIVQMQEQIEYIKTSEIQKAKNRLPNLTEREEQIIERLANGIVNRWMHQPMVNMKKLAGRRIDQIDCYIQAMHDILGLASNALFEEGDQDENL